MPDAPAAEATHPRIRTFHARHGRMTALVRRTLADVLPHLDPSLRDPARPLVLEVGCGHGDAALAFADTHPHLDVLATDVHAPGVAHLALALEDAPRPNVFVRHQDALDLLDHDLATAGLVGLHLLFPDPWPKARHHKRRFVRPDVVELLADRLAPGATLLVATDVDTYASAARGVLDAHPSFDGGPAPRPNWRPSAGYEARALAAGRAVHELAYRRTT